MQSKWKRTRRGAVRAAQNRAAKQYARRFNVSGKGQGKRVRMSGRKTYYFKEKVSLTAIDPSNTAGEITRQYLFSINSLPNIAEYQALFESYKINGVKLEFRVRKQPGAISNITLPILYTAIDYDGEANAAISVSNLLQRSNTKITYMSDRVTYMKIYFKPKQLQQAVNLDATVNPPTVTSVGRYMSSAKWNDIQQGASLYHYGVLLAAPGAGVTVNSCPVDVWATYYFACKQQM